MNLTSCTPGGSEELGSTITDCKIVTENFEAYSGLKLPVDRCACAFKMEHMDDYYYIKYFLSEPALFDFIHENKLSPEKRKASYRWNYYDDKINDCWKIEEHLQRKSAREIETKIKLGTSKYLYIEMFFVPSEHEVSKNDEYYHLFIHAFEGPGDGEGNAVD